MHLNDYRDLIKKFGFKVTAARLKLLETLDLTKYPVSILELYEKLGRRYDPTTLYRNIRLLMDLGLVKQIEFRGKEAYFELANRDDHHHLVCVRCGLVEDFKGCNIDKVSKTALKQSKKFNQISEHSLELFGICKNCFI